MAMNLAMLRAMVRDLTGTLDPIGLPDAVIDGFLNECYQEICTGRDWDFMESTFTIDVPAGSNGPFNRGTDGNGDSVLLTAPLSVTFDHGPASVELTQIQTERFVTLEESATGTPRYVGVLHADAVVIDGVSYPLTRSLRLWPTPTKAGTLTIRQTRSVPDLFAETDHPIFDPTLHPMLAYGAAAKVLTRDADDSNRAASYSQTYSSYAQRMVRLYRGWRDRAPLVVGGGFGRSRRSW